MVAEGDDQHARDMASADLHDLHAEATPLHRMSTCPHREQHVEAALAHLRDQELDELRALAGLRMFYSCMDG